MCWVWLFLAILLEVAATIALKLSNGFTKLAPTLTMAVLYGISFLPLALALRKMDVGLAYAVWSAVGTAMVTIIGIFLFRESVSPVKLLAIGLIIAGVVTLNLSERKTENSAPDQTARRTSGLLR